MFSGMGKGIAIDRGTVGTISASIWMGLALALASVLVLESACNLGLGPTFAHHKEINNSSAWTIVGKFIGIGMGMGIGTSIGIGITRNI